MMESALGPLSLPDLLLQALPPSPSLSWPSPLTLGPLSLADPLLRALRIPTCTRFRVWGFGFRVSGLVAVVGVALLVRLALVGLSNDTHTRE